jgi:DNA ligase (NAD+)
MGIANVGATVAREIAAAHGRMSDLPESPVLKEVVANAEKKAKERRILPIKAEAAKAVLAFFAGAYGRGCLARLLALGIDPQRAAPEEKATQGPLAGVGCVLTGSLSRPRGDYAKLIERAGGVVQSAVTSRTRYLIAGANVGAAKTEKARALGTEVIDEARLLALLAASGPAGAPLPEPPASPEPPVQGELF